MLKKVEYRPKLGLEMQNSYNKNELKKIINEVKSTSKTKKILSGFVISTTSKKSKIKMIILPIRRSNFGIFGCVTVYDKNLAKEIAKFVDGKVDLIIVDSEIKLENFQDIFNQINKVTKKSKVISFKNNDLTVDAIYVTLQCLVNDFVKKKISIVGAGNIGSKLALKLVESGANVNVATSNTKNSQKIANALNIIKPLNCKTKVAPKKIAEIANNVDVLIGLTPGIPIIDKHMINLMKQGGILIDGGVGTIHQSAFESAIKKKIKIIRIDVRVSFFAGISMILETEKFLESVYGIRKYKGIRIVAGGAYGILGDIVVDNISKPSKILGFADGKGGLIRTRIPSKFKTKLKIVQDLIKN